MSSSAGSSSKKAKHKTGSNVMFTNAVYFPSHRLYRGASPGALNYSCISIVYYGFARVFEDGGVFVSPVRAID